MVPEVPTIIFSGGCVYPGLDAGHSLILFEKSIIDLQIQMEQSFIHIAQSTGRPTVLIMDRGLMDIAAYLPEKQWKELLAYAKVQEDHFVNRYDMVVHLVTAADGAEKHYTTENNAARRETAEESRTLDKKIVKCWQSHKRHKIVDNSTGFKDKLARVEKSIFELVVPVPTTTTATTK